MPASTADKYRGGLTHYHTYRAHRAPAIRSPYVSLRAVYPIFCFLFRGEVMAVCRSRSFSCRQAISYNSVSETEKERCRIANPVWLSYNKPENGDFSGFHFRMLFSDEPPAEKRGPFSDEIPIRKWHPDLVLHMSWEATSVVTSRKQSSSTAV